MAAGFVANEFNDYASGGLVAESVCGSADDDGPRPALGEHFYQAVVMVGVGVPYRTHDLGTRARVEQNTVAGVTVARLKLVGLLVEGRRVVQGHRYPQNFYV